MKIWKYIIGFLVLSNFTIWLANLSFPDNNLHLVACDVGQGDAILASLGSSQILIDGGPDAKILECLGKNMPFWDKKIEVIVLSHSQKDHFGGLIDVLKTYQGVSFFLPKLEADTDEYQVLKNLVGGGKTDVRFARAGQGVRLGKMYLEIVWPTDQILAENKGPNDLSVVANLSFGEFDALLTGDAPAEIFDKLALSEVEWVKIPHHGSKNGLSKELLEVTKPKVAVISVGKNNSYGHPHEEILKILRDRGIKILRTDEMGDIKVVSDGEKYWVK